MQNKIAQRRYQILQIWKNWMKEVLQISFYVFLGNKKASRRGGGALTIVIKVFI